MKRLVFVILLALLLPTGGSHAFNPEDPFPFDTIRLNDIRYQVYPTHTRVVIDFDRPPVYTLNHAADSSSISIYLSKTILGETLREKPILLLQGALEKVDVKEEDHQKVLVVLTFKEIEKQKAMVITKPNRLVIDVDHPAIGKKQEEVKQATVPIPKPPNSASNTIDTIVIDPGHGGEDSGAIGPTGLTESDIVLDVSLRLKTLIEENLKKRVIMTRSNNIFIPLKERTEIANTNKADLFVSVHANASTRRSAQGIETYLFGRASDERALQTAARENETDTKSAQNFQEVILNDLLRDFTINEALELAHYTQKAFEKTLIPDYPTASLGVKKAPFYVLAHTNMPAILAEISFVSNKVEEKRMRQSAYRQRIAESILKGLKEYIAEKER